MKQITASVVGFSGSRSLSSAWTPLVRRVVEQVIVSGASVLVGCAAGADALVRASCPGARVFSAQSLFPALPPRQALAARSVALVRALVPSGQLVAFTSGPCPAYIFPARKWESGMPPSGTWSTLALAAGLGLPAFLFWCTPGPPALPDWPCWSWSPVAAGPFAGSWRLGLSRPAAGQEELF